MCHITSIASAGKINIQGVIQAKSVPYAIGVYATAIKSGCWATISEAASTEATISLSGSKALATPFPGTFRIVGNVTVY